MAEIKLLSNPRKRTVTRKKRRVARKRNPIVVRRANPAKRRVKRRAKKSNAIIENVQTGLVAGSGAVLLDVVLGYATFIPADLRTGAMAPVVKAGAAIGLGMALDKSKLVKPATSKKMVGGMLAVTAHDVLKSQLQNMAPNIPMGEYSVTGDGMGYLNPALNVGVDNQLPVAMPVSPGMPEGVSMGEYSEDDYYG